MEYVQFGNTGAKVSRLGFGGAPAGLKNYLERYDPVDLADRRAMQQALERALELGITYFDTAPGYGQGQGEEIFGEVLAEAGAPIFLATKVSLGDREHVRRSIHASLRHLRREQLDLLQIHGGSYTAEAIDQVLRAGGMLEEMCRLKEEGLVRFIGFTSEDTNEAVYHFVRTGLFDTLQICYNLLYQHPYDPSRPFGSLLAAEKAGLGIVTMRTATSGTFQRWVQMVNPGNTFDYTPALIQYVLSNPLVDVALVGMRNADEVARNVAIADDLAGRIDLVKLHTRYV
jgi:aryl-alcohol dehydrogenase-like predicted oxidoreductase